MTIVNEVGVDPGIDHMLAMQCFDEVKKAGGKVGCYTFCYKQQNIGMGEDILFIFLSVVRHSVSTFALLTL